MRIPGGPVDIPDEMISTLIRPDFATLAPAELFPGVASHLDRPYAGVDDRVSTPENIPWLVLRLAAPLLADFGYHARSSSPA